MSHEFYEPYFKCFDCYDFMYRFNFVIDFVNRAVRFMGGLIVAKLLNRKS